MNERLARAIDHFQRANAADPNRVAAPGGPAPRELHAARRLAARIDELEPNASEPLRLAAWCQHLRRWEVPRSSFPEGRLGYLTWRKALMQFHADLAAGILREVGYDEETVEAVRRINLKQGLKTHSDTQTMEDALCLDFLEYELTEFSARYDDAKLVNILRKTWHKLSERGRARARELELGPRAAGLLEQALAETAPEAS